MRSIDRLLAAHAPDGVSSMRLRDVGIWYGGGTPSKAVREFWEGGSIPWLSPKDMDVETVEATGLCVSEAALQQSPLKLIPAGSVAFVVRSNVLRRRLPIALVPFEVTLNQDMRAVVPHESVLADYLLLACRSRSSEILAATGRTDGSMAAINGPGLLDFTIPVPPIPVQEEIVRVLKRLSALQTELEAKLEAELVARRSQFEHYRNALLTLPETEGGGWPLMALGEVGKFFRGKRFTKADYVDDGVPCIHYGEIYTEYGPSTDRVVSHVREDLRPTLRFAQPGDVVIVDVGETVEDVGKAVAWLGDGDVAIHDHCFAFRHEMNPAFVAYYMQTSRFHAQKAKHVARTKVKTLLMDGLAKVLIPVPANEEQERVVTILDEFDALTNDLSVGLPAEIKARRAQYEHYRDRLLTFDEAVA